MLVPMSVINLRRRRLVGRRELIVMALAVILTSAGIKASDRFFNEADDGGDSGPCGVDMVFVTAPGGGFCIDRYEASAAAICAYADPGTQAQTRENLEQSGCAPVSQPGMAPWRNLSRDQAALACAKAGKRLPTNAEWLAAALGTPDPDSGWGGRDCQVSSNWPAQPGNTGSGADCVSAAGAYDMVGNVWEWVQGAVSDGAYEGESLPPQGFIDALSANGSLPLRTNADTPNPNYRNDYLWLKTSGERGIVRGGYWDNGGQAGAYAVYAVTPPDQTGVGIGFRCVK